MVQVRPVDKSVVDPDGFFPKTLLLYAWLTSHAQRWSLAHKREQRPIQKLFSFSTFERSLLKYSHRISFSI